MLKTSDTKRFVNAKIAISINCHVQRFIVLGIISMEEGAQRSAGEGINSLMCCEQSRAFEH